MPKKHIELFDKGTHVVDMNAAKRLRALKPHIEKMFNYPGEVECKIPKEFISHKYESVDFVNMQNARNRLMKELGMYPDLGPVEARRREVILETLNNLNAQRDDVLNELERIQGNLRSIQSTAYFTIDRVGANQAKLERQITDEHRELAQDVIEQMYDPADHVRMCLKEGNVLNELSDIIKSVREARK